jgi:uncharacterized protein YqgC (DUF456 family)
VGLFQEWVESGGGGRLAANNAAVGFVAACWLNIATIDACPGVMLVTFLLAVVADLPAEAMLLCLLLVLLCLLQPAANQIAE